MFEVKKLHIKLTIIGKVQGVGYRYAAKNMAISLGITGMAKNLLNGNVYIEAEGSELQIHHFVEWCRNGPTYSNVTEVLVEFGEIKDYQKFKTE